MLHKNLRTPGRSVIILTRLRTDRQENRTSIPGRWPLKFRFWISAKQRWSRVKMLIGIVGGGVQLGPLGTAATNRPTVSAPGDYDGEIGAMIGRGNWSTRRKPAPVPIFPPQTPHAARTRTRAAAVGRQRLTAWATARPWSWVRFYMILLRRSRWILT
jgi:hypothetical protein